VVKRLNLLKEYASMWFSMYSTVKSQDTTGLSVLWKVCDLTFLAAVKPKSSTMISVFTKEGNSW